MFECARFDFKRLLVFEDLSMDFMDVFFRGVLLGSEKSLPTFDPAFDICAVNNFCRVFYDLLFDSI